MENNRFWDVISQKFMSKTYDDRLVSCGFGWFQGFPRFSEYGVQYYLSKHFCIYAKSVLFSNLLVHELAILWNAINCFERFTYILQLLRCNSIRALFLIQTRQILHLIFPNFRHIYLSWFVTYLESKVEHSIDGKKLN